MYFALHASPQRRLLCRADVPLMIKGGFQHSLSTFTVHLHHLIDARDDNDVRIFEDEA